MVQDAPAWLRTSSSREVGGPAASSGPSVLFVCTGNICRSAFAEVYMRHVLGPNSSICVKSAGIMALAGQPLDATLEVQARHHGVSDTHHVARQLTGRMLNDATVIFIFGPEHYQWISRNYPDHVAKVVGLGQSVEILKRLPSGYAPSLKALPAVVRHHVLARNSALWIPDPYKRGADAASEAATRIRGDIDTIASSLALPN